MRSWPCVGCGKFAFPTKAVRCYWCTNTTPKPQPAPEVKRRPTMDELKQKAQAIKYDKRRKRERGAG